MVPAPRPRGIEDRHNCHRFVESEVPPKPITVSNTLKEVIFPAENLLIILGLPRLEIIVSAVITNESQPAEDMGTLRSLYIAGHAAPSKESGIPRPINDI